MDRKRMTRRVQFYAQYFPFTVNTLLIFLSFWLAYRLLYRPIPQKAEEPAAFLPFILLLAKLAFWFCLLLILVSIVSTFVAWTYYLWRRQSQPASLNLQFVPSTGSGKKGVRMKVQVKGARRPLLGFVKGRLFYDDLRFTDFFTFLSNKKKPNHFWRTAISGDSQLVLHDIREYELKGGFLFFQDMLHLLSLAAFQPLSGHFYQPPTELLVEDAEVFPKKTESPDVRIDHMKRVEGDYFNYKDFEAGDDVRRIVWKVYAKNRDLVVRRPEMFEPFASHLYFYASFYADVKGAWLDSAYSQEMLNYYKARIWSVYKILAAKEWQLRYIPDQSFQFSENGNTEARDARVISNSKWQRDIPTSAYFNWRQGAVLCISSFTDPRDLSQLLEQCDGNTVVYFVKCSHAFRHYVLLGLLQRIFFLPPKDRLNRLRTTWTFSPLNFQLRKCEKEIEELLRRSAVRSGVI